MKTIVMTGASSGQLAESRSRAACLGEAIESWAEAVRLRGHLGSYRGSCPFDLKRPRFSPHPFGHGQTGHHFHSMPLVLNAGLQSYKLGRAKRSRVFEAATFGGPTIWAHYPPSHTNFLLSRESRTGGDPWSSPQAERTDPGGGENENTRHRRPTHANAEWLAYPERETLILNRRPITAGLRAYSSSEVVQRLMIGNGHLATPHPDVVSSPWIYACCLRNDSRRLTRPGNWALLSQPPVLPCEGLDLAHLLAVTSSPFLRAGDE